MSPHDPQSNYTEYPVATAPPPLQLGRYRAALRQKWWILVASLALTVGAAVAHLYVRPAKFSSKATMWVSGKFQVGNVAQYTEDVQNFYGTQIELFTSGKMMERALNRLKAANPGFNPPKNDKGGVIVPDIKVTQAPKSAVFDLESVNTNAVYAQGYLDAVMDEFLAYKKEVRTASSGNALSSVSDQVYKQERELKLEQEKLSEFQRTNNVALLQEQATGGGNQLGQLNTQLAANKLELQLLDAVSLEESIGKGPNNTNLLSAPADGQKLSFAGSTNVGSGWNFLTARQQVQILKITRQQLSKYLRPKHPKIVKLDEEITRGEQVLEFFGKQNQEQMAVAKQALKIRIESVQDTIKGLEKQVGEATLRLSGLELMKNNIVRQQSLYDRLLTLLQSVDINNTMDQENVAILERASIPLLANGSALKVLAAAIFLGGCLGVGLLFLVAKFDDRCDTLEELRSQFEEEIFGQIPDVGGGAANGFLPPLKLEDDRHIFAESCRNLRSLLLSNATGDRHSRTILVTSAAPDEGKSTIAVNLARVLAFGGARTLLVDCDLRRGHLHECLGVANIYGLSDYLCAEGQRSEATGQRTAGQIAGGEGQRQKTEDGQQGIESREQMADDGGAQPPLLPPAADLRPLTSETGSQSPASAPAAPLSSDLGSLTSGSQPSDPAPTLASASQPYPLSSGFCPLHTDLDNLFLVPRGTQEHNASELFLKPAFETFLQAARQDFDFVILDSIPVFAADDATTLASKMDGVLFVVRSGHTGSKLAQHALDLLYQRQAKVLGLVFNRVDSRRSSYRYYKYSKYYKDAKA